MFKQHWSKRYIIDRIKDISFRKFNPDFPWLTPDAISFLNLWISKSDLGLEFGSGRSTVWFAEKCRSLISIEDDTTWYYKLSSKLLTRGISNVDYRFCKSSKSETVSNSEYVKVLRDYGDFHFDFILVDGSHRDYVALNCLSKIKLGGIVIVDNANWFIPHQTISPTSIGENNLPFNKTWDEFHLKVAKWRQIWTTNGVTDTAIYVKPNI